MDTSTGLGVSVFLAIAILVCVWAWRKLTRKYLVIGIALVALIVASIAIMSLNRPLQAWADHNDSAKGIATFEVPRSSGNYQGRSFAFDSRLTKDQVFMEFREQYPEATIDSDRAFVQVSGEELQVAYAPNTEAPDYTLEFVQP